MKQAFEGESVKGVIDPHNHWPDINHRELYEWTGFLPAWFISYSFFPDKEEGGGVKDFMDKAYGFGLHEMTGGSVTEDDIHQYPEDPDMYPIITLEATNGSQMIQWEHGIVAFRDSTEDEWFITRMD